MRCRVMASFALVLVAAAGCGDRDGGRGNDGGCTPGQQMACPCAGGTDGVQVCNDDGVGYGACVGCGDEGSTGSSASSSGEPVTTTTTATTDIVTSTSTSDQTDAGPSTSGSETAASLFLWVWVDHPGPAFVPHACAAGGGVVDGMLVDPQAFFESLVEGRDPNDWVAVMNEIEPSLWACGLGQQRSSGGEVRGRLFLPHESCPDAAPPADDPKAMFLGVRQEPACWDHPVDVVSESGP